MDSARLAQLNYSFENSKTISLQDFLTRSALEGDSDWLSLAQAWGRKQSPMILVDPQALQAIDLITALFYSSDS